MEIYGGRVHVDLGAGDAQGPYRWALRRPEWMYIATDVNGDGLLETAKRAARKPSRGGVGNLLCVAEPLETLAAGLPGCATRITAVLPWGSLLRALVLPETEQLSFLRRLSASGAAFELVVSYDAARDAGEFRRLGVPALHPAFFTEVLAEAYESCGFSLVSCRTLTPAELASFQTTWARRLALGGGRGGWSIRFQAGKPEASEAFDVQEGG